MSDSSPMGNPQRHNPQAGGRPTLLLIAGFMSLLLWTLTPVCVWAQENVRSAETTSWDSGAVTPLVQSVAIPISTVVAGSGFQDLGPLKRVLKGVRVLGLGESTHGTREFFQLKHRLLEFAASELGFRAFVIEASYAAAWRVNEFVLHGRGDPGEALAGLGFWTWDTEEVLEMIRWMREYNFGVSEGDRLRFYGMDPQRPQQGITLVRDYLQAVAPELLPAVDLQLKTLEVGTEREREAEAKEQAAIALIGHLSFNENDLVRRSSAEAFSRALHHARVLLQDLKGQRDRYMAENVQTVLSELPHGSRIVLWGHDGHINHMAREAEAPPSLGYLLKERMGDEYYSVAFSFGRGGFQARDLDQEGILAEHRVADPQAGTLDWQLAAVGLPAFWLDHSRLQGFQEAERWLGAEQPYRSVGGLYRPSDPAQFMGDLIVPAKYADAFIFLSETSRARPTPTGMRGKMSPEVLEEIASWRRSGGDGG